MTRPQRLLALAALPLVTVAASPYVAWEDLTEADWLFPVATRVATVDGMAIHYPTPTEELVTALEGRTETAALRHLAEARRDMGDTEGALAALERWAEAEGAEAWAEAARWAASRGEAAFAFRAADLALPRLPPDAARALMNERVAWAERMPGHVDPIALRESRAKAFPQDALVVEDWIRSLERAGRLDEATTALGSARSLSRERRLLLASDLAADHGHLLRAQQILDASLDEPLSPGADVARAFADRTDGALPGAPLSWRTTLDRTFDAGSLVRLTTYFQGKERGDAASELLRQVERRHSRGFDRAAWLLVARLYQEIDAIPEAFRAVLAASHEAKASEQELDLGSLARLALAAGGRPLPLGLMSDAHSQWVAAMDRTPGFWTGGLSLLLTGQDWRKALDQIEQDALPERTFATARLLVDELARRAPASADLPSLRVAVMRRHVERGEGERALALLPLVEPAAADIADAGRKQALLALRQVSRGTAEEARLFVARLRFLAADGTRPLADEESSPPGFLADEDAPTGQAWARYFPETERDRYGRVLDEAIERLDRMDRTHRSALGLILGEMDRLPDAEALWNRLADRLQVWNLDDDLGPRFERALQRFDGPGIWPRLARWYTRRARHAELRRLGADLASQFRGSEIFARTSFDGSALEIPEQPLVGDRVRLVAWADWVRLVAIQRFPHSPTAYREAAGRFVRQSHWAAHPTSRPGNVQPLVVDDALLDARRAAIVFIDDGIREEYFAESMRKGTLVAHLTKLESLPSRTPVEDLLLFEGWSRLSEFERAAPFALRLAERYPGDQKIAGKALSLQRSLVALRAASMDDARALVEAATRASLDPTLLLTELGELEIEAGRSDAAVATWKRILDREPGNPRHIESVATLLWDYERPEEAKAVIEAGRAVTGRKRLLAFEAGVLREQVKDIDGAVREYLSAAQPDGASCFCSWFDRDQRSLRRLSQLMARERVLARILATIEAIEPGLATAEETLIALLPLARIEMPDEGLDFTSDDWIDALDAPNDPVGRARREAARRDWRPRAREGMARVGEALLARSLALVATTSRPAFLDAMERASWSILAGRTTDDAFRFRAALLERRAALAPTEEERVTREVGRARFLLDGGKAPLADALWRTLSPRVEALPAGLSRMEAEGARASFIERTAGQEAAALDWERLTTAYPWSLGILEDRLALLQRAGRNDEARAVLEKVAASAAIGHREALLERLTREALEARDLPQARRAVEALLSTPDLPSSSTLGGSHLLVRLALREAPDAEILPLVRSREASVPESERAVLYAEAARAAVAERVFATATDLWIEALNRRLERSWIREGFLASDHAGRGETFRSFFEKQQQRSPRDVRWAVAVREIRRMAGDVDGAVEMARIAVAVRPERESLWMEAVDILTRAGRFREAALFLAGWQETRSADSAIAAQRAALLVRAGDPAAALAVEREALEAFVKQGPMDEDRKSERDSRIAAMANRFLELGLPQEAWKALAIPGAPKATALDAMGAWDASRLALAANRFTLLLSRKAQDEDWRYGLASTFSTTASSSQKNETLRFLVEAISPHPTPSMARRVAALRKYWPVAEEAGLAQALRSALARRALEGVEGPWTAEAPADFVADIGSIIVEAGITPGPTLRDATPDLDRLWVRELVRRDRAEDLYVFLEPRWSALVTEVLGNSPLPAQAGRASWTLWLDDPQTMDTFVRGASAEPRRMEALASILAHRRSWDRLWRLAARGKNDTTAWPVSVIVAALPEEARATWFRTWQSPSPGDPDAILAARGRSLFAAERAVVRLLLKSPPAEKGDVLERLRGPRTVGEVLSSDARWQFPEFAARPSDSGEDRVVGSRKDELRLPGALWGARPGSAWYALEMLARLREKDPLAPLVPLEVPERGRENDRLMIAMDAAALIGNPNLALDLDRAAGGVASGPRLQRRLALLLRAGRRDDAAREFADEVRRSQSSLKEASFRSLRRLGEEHGLGDAASLLDTSRPVDSTLLAHLVDQSGPTEARRLAPFDPAGFRSALSNRWQERLTSLSPESFRFFLTELWARDAAPLPSERALRRLGPFWAPARSVLALLPVEARADGLAAVDALPDDARFEALVKRLGLDTQETVQLLRVRTALANGRGEDALRLLSGVLDAALADRPLAWTPVAPAPYSSNAEDDAPPVFSDENETANRLARWLQPFSEAEELPSVAERFRAVLAVLRERDPASVTLWRLSFEVTGEREDLARQMDRAWLAGSWTPEGLGPLVEMVSQKAPSAAPDWIPRWNAGRSWDNAERKARVLATLGRKAEAASAIVLTRKGGALTAENERLAFDAWRRLGPSPDAPPDWTAAAAFWTAQPGAMALDLGRHLRHHPMDILAARAALRTVAPGDPDAMRLASRAMEGSPEPSDAAVLALRSARAEASWRSARRLLDGGLEPSALPQELERRRFPGADRRAALAQVVRILHRSGERPEMLLAHLEDASPEDARALLAELRSAPSSPVATYRMVAGEPKPYRPRDVDWGLVSAVLAAEVER